MENKELLFNLIKKLDSGELVLNKKTDDENGKLFLEDTTSKQKITIGKLNTKTTQHYMTKRTFIYTNLKKYDPDWNNEFKENFYKEKGIKCWVSDCQNKILIQDGDHKKVKVPCQENHTRIVCVDCSKKYE